MCEKIRVVPAEEAHLEALARLERLCFSTPWSEQALREGIREPSSVFFTALLGKTPAGYLGMQAPADEGYITNVAVFPAYRRQGAARSLLRRAARYAEAKGLRFISLEVRPSNRAAIRLYESEGYRPVGERRNFYSAPTENALIMTKFLSERGNTL